MACEFIVLRLQARPEIAQDPIGEGGLGHPGCVSIPPRCGILLVAGVSRDRRGLHFARRRANCARDRQRGASAAATKISPVALIAGGVVSAPATEREAFSRCT